MKVLIAPHPLQEIEHVYGPIIKGAGHELVFSRVTHQMNEAELMDHLPGCAGSLASDPDMCAALNRHVATLPAAQQSDPSQYYTVGPANYYAKFWHDNAINSVVVCFTEVPRLFMPSSFEV